MSTLGTSLEAKTKVLVQIAAENNIVVHPNEHFGVVEEVCSWAKFLSIRKIELVNYVYVSYYLML